MLGVANVRGRLLPIMDLALFFGLDRGSQKQRDKRILIVEVKRQLKRYSHNTLVMKSSGLLERLKLKNYHIEYQCFSLDNLDNFLEKKFE